MCFAKYKDLCGAQQTCHSVLLLLKFLSSPSTPSPQAHITYVCMALVDLSSLLASPACHCSGTACTLLSNILIKCYRVYFLHRLLNLIHQALSQLFPALNFSVNSQLTDNLRSLTPIHSHPWLLPSMSLPLACNVPPSPCIRLAQSWPWAFALDTLNIQLLA